MTIRHYVILMSYLMRAVEQIDSGCIIPLHFIYSLLLFIFRFLLWHSLGEIIFFVLLFFFCVGLVFFAVYFYYYFVRMPFRGQYIYDFSSNGFFWRNSLLTFPSWQSYKVWWKKCCLISNIKINQRFLPTMFWYFIQ